jgi:hypothetical protein
MQTCANAAPAKPLDLDEFIAAAQRARLLYPLTRQPYEVTRAELDALRRLAPGAPDPLESIGLYRGRTLFGMDVVVKD